MASNSPFPGHGPAGGAAPSSAPTAGIRLPGAAFEFPAPPQIPNMPLRPMMPVIPVGAAQLDAAMLRRLLNERYLLSRRVERDGLRRIFIACMLFVGFKFVRHRFFGKKEDTAF